MTDEQALDDTGSDWPLRPWLLAGMLGLAGLLIWLVTDGKDDDPVRMAGAAFLFFGPMAAAFSLERDSWKQAAIFALIAGLVMAGLAWRAVSGQELYADEEYGFAAGVVATVIALPLFQSGFHRTRFATPYRTIHFNAWTDAVSAAGSLAFLGLTWLMTLLLANLFQLLKIDFLMDLIDEGWFGWSLSGAAFGAALGVLRSKLGILGMLQHVVMLVLSLLAVPLALALVVFLGAMVVSGPDVLWEATRSATPILLACAAGAWVLTNAIVRDDDTEMSRNVVLRVTSLVLALSLLPLTAFAAVSMGTRVAAYGLSPERLWALVAIAVACSFGVAYLVVVVRGRLAGWRALLRRANLNLAAGLSVVALFLALPILDFGSISAANQLARLERGAVTPEEFDFDALKWEFGKAGEKALAKLAASGNASIAELAQTALVRPRWDYEHVEYIGRMGGPTARERLANIRIEPSAEAHRKAIEAWVRQPGWTCQQPCIFLSVSGGDELVVLSGSTAQRLHLDDAGWIEDELKRAEVMPVAEVKADSEIEIRPYVGRQIYVDGEPIGEPFE